MVSDPVVIAGYARTPIGSFQGALSGLRSPELGAIAIKAAVERSAVEPARIDKIYMGCVLAAALGQAPARQSALGAGLLRSTEATTINKMCGSGMQAAILACDTLSAGSADIVLAGGMESMTNAPYALLKHRAGARIGHDQLFDTMMLDGLEDAYDRGKPMGVFAEEAVARYGFTRKEQDDYALRSLSRAQRAIAEGYFVDEIAPVSLGGSEKPLVDTDEQPGRAKPDKVPSLKPAFAIGGTITAANAASISDGAAALVLTRRSIAEKLGMMISARVVAHAAYAGEPGLFTTAPVPAIRQVMDRASWSVGDVDLFEVNEAFAVVAMIAARDLAIPLEKLNVNGGATVLGHPIGASGARILVTLLAALKARNLRRGIAGICIGGGEATAIALERD
jgi:acetyl-CoA C-acetyltransferase